MSPSLSSTLSTRDAHRRCAGCGYDLHGLPQTARCPECGLPVQAPRTLDDPLSTMPVCLIRPLVIAAWLASACFLYMVVIFIAGAALHQQPLVQSMQLLGLAFIWCIAAWILTRPMTAPAAISRGFGEQSGIRRAARWLQGGWLLAAASLLSWNWITRAAMLAKAQSAAVTIGTPQQPAPGAKSVFGEEWLPLIGGLGWAGVVAGLGGLILLTLLLQRLAEWVRDDSAERAFGFALWGTPIATLILMMNLPVLLIGVVVGLFWILCAGMFPYGLFSLSQSLTWSIRHSHEYQDRLRRRRERAEQQAAEIAQSVEQMDAARERGSQ